jgi:hypothetical protein
MGRRLRAITRTIRRRSGEAKTQVMALTERTGQLLQTSVEEARRLAATARRKAGGPRRPGEAARRGRAGGTCRSLPEGLRADRPARQGREDHQPPDLAVEPRCAADSQGQARQAQRVRVRHADRDSHTKTKPRRARPDRASRLADRQTPSRTSCFRRPSRNSSSSGSRPRRPRWTAASPSRRHRTTRRPPARARVYLRAPAARLPAHPTAVAALPHRRRRTHQPPQPRLRPTSQPAEGR